MLNGTVPSVRTGKHQHLKIMSKPLPIACLGQDGAEKDSEETLKPEPSKDEKGKGGVQGINTKPMYTVVIPSLPPTGSFGGG